LVRRCGHVQGVNCRQGRADSYDCVWGCVLVPLSFRNLLMIVFGVLSFCLQAFAIFWNPSLVEPVSSQQVKAALLVSSNPPVLSSARGACEQEPHSHAARALDEFSYFCSALHCNRYLYTLPEPLRDPKMVHALRKSVESFAHYCDLYAIHKHKFHCLH